MNPNSLAIQDLWAVIKPNPFKPNPNQEKSILHTDGPLFLTAGPGSGKTRVLLWRTLNLIVFHNVKPEEIFLSTFTEKAAFQLQEGLRSLLGIATNLTGVPYDISRMYVGTVHSLCQRLIRERRLSTVGKRPIAPALKDALGQYFYISRRAYWERITEAGNFSSEPNAAINELFDSTSSSKHVAVTNCISLFNRFSEECLEPSLMRAKTNDEVLISLIDMYEFYKNSLNPQSGLPQTDFSLIQQQALNILEASTTSENIFKHIIIDEYQDTNTIQEKLIFKLAVGHKNICIVGDDDQALYRFRGATVENFVEFPQRCQQYIGCNVEEITLNINYRSRQKIVGFYSDFISRCNWKKTSGQGFYRIANKNIQAHSQDTKTSVIASTPTKPDNVCAEIADLVKQLIDTKKVQDPNQIAFLYPSLKSAQVQRMIDALESVGLKVYAPRARRFLEVEEAIAVFGIYLKIFGKPSKGSFSGQDYSDFHNWMNKCVDVANTLIQQDKALAEYVRERQEEIKTVISDYQILLQAIEQNKWDLSQPYDIAQMKRPLYNARGLSDAAKKSLGSSYFERVINQRTEEGNPFPLSYVVNAATSVDWSVLDLFYRLCIFDHFKAMFDIAEIGKDEAPICNMGLITQYLARFTDEYASVITGHDFIYKDNYSEPLEAFLRKTGQVDEEGNLLTSNPKAGGRFHSNWLNMIYPRLRVAKNFLQDDGVIFISIDENEADNLKFICNEIFGEENLLGRLVWKNATDNNPTNIAVEHEYVLVYCKNRGDIASVWKSSVSDIKDIIVRKGQEWQRVHELKG